jgi:murein DD-endopeptidase MepM/ murein hydrolase activator NlpD
MSRATTNTVSNGTRWQRVALTFVLGCLVSYGGGQLFMAAPVAAQTVEQLRAQIAERESRLGEIEKEIAEFEAALQEVGAERSTLEAAIRGLELERQKISADISYTENQISNTDLEINKLTIEINQALRDIEQNRAAIAEIIRAIDETDDETLIEVLLTNAQLSDFWTQLDDLETIRNAVGEQVEELRELQAQLENNREDESEKREDLVDLKEQYDGQRQVLVHNQAEQNQLLTATRNEESEYQRLLDQKKAAREQLRQEVQNIEQELQFILDPNTIPTPGTPVFRWPLDNNIITQRFGYTQFALSGAYGGSRHNGMDLGTPSGSKLYATLSGVVRDTGNTDLVPGCFSWGKWILLDHPNGLSSMYAHLSHISVTPGQTVRTGDIVGYTGNTGYSTGPHLHWTLYVSDAVQVRQFNEFKSVTSCGSAKSPFAAIEGYLDPLDYLPPL